MYTYNLTYSGEAVEKWFPGKRLSCVMLNIGQKIYSDELVSATELNRQPGHVLDMALKRPITITRNDQAFALLLREDAARMANSFAHAEVLFNLAGAIYSLSTSRGLDSQHSYSWLKAFDRDEIEQLFAEIHEAFSKALAGEDSWDNFEAVLHEWHESALAIMSEELAEAFAAEVDEMPLTEPLVIAAASED
jgi:hypothetical protein